MKLELAPAELARVKGILCQYLPANLPVLAFGSRANGQGRVHSGSDLDLAIISQTPLSVTVLGNLNEAFSASDLPFRVDLLDWARTAPDFQDKILTGYQVLMPDFFVSYTASDQGWAEWIAYQLEDAGYSTVLQAWDFKTGQNFVHQIHQAARFSGHTLAVLSPQYLHSTWCTSESLAALVQDPVGLEQKLIGVKVAACQPTGLLAGRVYIDLVGKAEGAAKSYLLKEIAQALNSGRNKPISAPPFPVASSDSGHTTLVRRSVSAPLHFPNDFRHVFNFPSRNASFVGREAEFAQLSASLLDTAESRVAVISGIAGVGKSSLAVQVAYGVAHHFDALCWVVGESPEVLQQAYADLDQVLGLAVVGENLSIAARVQRVKHCLEHSQRVLLVIDNVGQAKDLAAYLPAHNSRVLLTSRPTVWDRARYQVVELVCFTPEEAHAFLTQALPQSSAPDQDQLAKELGHLPLALRQAVAYISDTGLDIPAYLSRWNNVQQQAELMASGKVEDYPQSLAAALTLSLARLQETHPAAYQLLQLAACFAPDDLPLSDLRGAIQALAKEDGDEGQEVLLAAYPDLITVSTNDLAWDAMWRALRVLALAECRTVGGTDSLSWHRLTLAFVRGQASRDSRAQYQDVTLSLLLGILPDDVQSHIAVWPIYRRWSAHLAVLLEPSLSMQREDQAYQLALTHLLNRYAIYIELVLADYVAALPLFERALAIHEKNLGATHPDTASSLNNLAGLYDTQGDYEAALPLYQRALAIREKVLGATHPDTATSLNNLAMLYDVQGEYGKALPLCERAVAIAQKTLGDNHPTTKQFIANWRACQAALSNPRP